MKELAAILQACASDPDRTFALATLVAASGSTYRRPGARMLILPDGGAVGSISGGCLERDVIEKSREIIAGGENIVLTYDTGAGEDIVFGAGLGCNGAIHVLVEPLRSGSPAAGLLSFIKDLFQRRETGIAATVFRIQGHVRAHIGDRLLLGPDEVGPGQIPDDTLHAKMLALAREAFSDHRSKTAACALSAGTADVFVEVIQSPAPLVIFGAGYDAVPMARLAHEVGFHVTVVDVRPAYATRERFPQADAVVVARPEGLAGLGLGERTAAVIMSHNYLTDRAFLQAMLGQPLRYLGLMGPRARAQKMLQELREEGFAADESRVRQLHNPVGLDIGAENPEQIALAILAEIQAVTSGHTGGLLRDKKGAIHAPGTT